MVTDPAVFNVTRPLLAFTVAIETLLLEYVSVPVLALDTTSVNGASVTFLVVGGFTNESVVVPLDTVSVLLVFVAALYWLVCACVALNETSPAPTKVIVVPDASTVATFVLLLLYVITPVLLLVGNVSNENGAFPNVLDDGTANDESESVDVARATVSVLLVIVALVY
jgi:hypothetical protein